VPALLRATHIGSTDTGPTGTSSAQAAPPTFWQQVGYLGVQFQINHLTCPSCVNPGSPMPPYASLGPPRLTQLALFLEASKGTH